VTTAATAARRKRLKRLIIHYRGSEDICRTNFGDFLVVRWQSAIAERELARAPLAAIRTAAKLRIAISRVMVILAAAQADRAEIIFSQVFNSYRFLANEGLGKPLHNFFFTDGGLEHFW